jgi:Flp pilus assembly pilin Flp
VTTLTVEIGNEMSPHGHVRLSRPNGFEAPRAFGVPGMTKGGESQMTYLHELVAAIREREQGQTMAEYGVILAVITVAIIGALLALSTGIFDNLMSVVGVLN